MFFPIRSDRRLNTTPWVNYALIGINVVIFLWLAADANMQLRVQNHFMLFAERPRLHQFITYQFLHAGWDHILGNMLFLYVFGNSVEDRLGKLGYAAFYLAGGVAAGLGHCMVSQSPVLGASGSVSAVTGAYLVLFPLSNVTIVYWFFFIGAFEVSSIVLILFQIGMNIIMHFGGGGNVAYMAHLAGYAYGIAIGAVLLLMRLLPREPYDLLALIEQRRRRSQFKRMTGAGYRPWDSSGRSEPEKADEPPKASESDRRLMDLRARISNALTERDITQAAELYNDLLELDANQVMSQQQQLDISNQLMSDGRYDDAARAYELFLGTFKSYPQREQVELILSMIYVKYLQRRQRAKELLTAALPRLQAEEHRELAESLMREIG